MFHFHALLCLRDDNVQRGNIMGFVRIGFAAWRVLKAANDNRKGREGERDSGVGSTPRLDAMREDTGDKLRIS